MIMNLLQNEGKCSIEKIAKSLLSFDQSQLEYYVNVTKNMVGRVLSNHKIVRKEKDEYILNGFEGYSDSECEALVELCREKLDQYIQKRGDKIWAHRRQSSGYISGTIRYEVMKRAKFHCELCGIPADVKALEVDHILPRNHGGSDELSNLQSLCYSCNAMKRDRDATNFHAIRESYKKRISGCVFCEPHSKRKIELENNLAYVIFDKFPVTDFHSLIIPKRHVDTYFELGQAEINATTSLLSEAKDLVIGLDPKVNGFNIGINIGQSSGQTINHCHIHLIPRRKGDHEKPEGGVRHVIPGKGYYSRN
ncbi:MAG: HIT domain-containing protein [Calditrichales bacterium]|nr:MAG: HIT domain-containing protein [Calditrichales bacterium]